MHMESFRKMVLRLLVLLMCISWLPTSLSADIRCATVNIELLLSKYDKAMDQSKALTAKLLKYRQELLTLQQRRKEMGQNIKDMGKKILQLDTPPPKGSDLRNEYNALNSEYQSLGKDIKELENEHIKTIRMDLSMSARKSLDEIQAAVQQYAREKGYQWVIETSGASNTRISPLIYAKNATDITEEMIPILNKDEPVKGKEKAATDKSDEKPAPSP